MKHNRYIPYGYTVGGEMIAEPSESETVRRIFKEYIDGLSYKKIAELLTAEGIRYHETNAVWNKNMVKRVLENEKYLGNERYPQIIDTEIFEKVTSLIASRRQRDYNTPEETEIRERLFCAECGERYHRYTQTAINSWWTCKMQGCIPIIKITDDLLHDAVNDVLNHVITQPELLNVPADNAKKYEPTVEVIRLTNEINRELEKTESDEEKLTKQILKCASVRYDACQIDRTPYTTETLKAEYVKADIGKNKYAELIEKSVSSIQIFHDGTIQIKFINGAIVCGQITPKKGESIC